MVTNRNLFSSVHSLNAYLGFLDPRLKFPVRVAGNPPRSCLVAGMARRPKAPEIANFPCYQGIFQ